MGVTERPGPAADGLRLERTISLTDAVVAIAMTLLVLPLVELAPDVDPDHLGPFLSEHQDLLTSFVISFLVIYVFWSAQVGTLHRLDQSGMRAPALRPFTVCWLLVIVFLPFPTAVVGRGVTNTSAPLYIGTMVVLSALSAAGTAVVDRTVGPPRQAPWAWLTTAVFAFCAVVSAIDPLVGMLCLLLLAVQRVIEVRVRRAERPADAPAPTTSPGDDRPQGSVTSRPAPPGG
jgi:uncharacterized membrane protein